MVPFVAWLFLMHMLGDPAGWKYAARSVVCLGLFLWLRPWRWYPPPRIRCFPFAAAVGVVVFGLWVVMETSWAGRWPGLQSLYLRWAVLPLGKVPEPLSVFPYAPETGGWGAAVVRLLGSALVISVIEEFFWRGFLYRWLIAKDFLRVDPGRLHALWFAVAAVFFAMEHNRWLAGLLAGVAYGLVYVRTRDLWSACLAHAVTNFLLGLYVLATASYSFW
ncbi:MAG: CAAX prenyl protease-related protein [Kiritimatiellae bacterium]|nr:CAAX prenyl protease-related protein [Kiritimatiellia bacterium]